MDLTFEKEVDDFRKEVRAFVRDNLPDDIRQAVASEHMELSRDHQQRWHKILHERGWACHEWPVEYGGMQF